MVLLRNICSLVPPVTGWDALPPAVDTTLEADIARIKYFRNTVYGHASEASVDDATFNQYWKDIQEAIVRLEGAGYQSAIDDLKRECMDPDFEEHYRELLKQWVMDEKSVKERLDEIRRDLHVLRRSLSRVGIKEKLDEIVGKLDAWKDAMVPKREKKIGIEGN